MNDDDAPWLAAAETQKPPSRRGPLVRLLVILGVLAAIAIGAVFVLLRPGQGSDEGYMEAAQAPLITAEPGPIKVKPDDPRGLDVEGQDQTLYAAGAGIDEGSNIDMGALPEEPMARPGSAPQATVIIEPAKNLLPQAMRPQAEAVRPVAPPNATPPVVTPPAATLAVKPPAPTPAPASRRTVQLGAFSTRERAETEWARLAARHGMLGFSPRYASVSRDGKTLWRLRAAGGDAAALCARLTASGDTCSMVSE